MFILAHHTSVCYKQQWQKYFTLQSCSVGYYSSARRISTLGSYTSIFVWTQSIISWGSHIYWYTCVHTVKQRRHSSVRSCNDMGPLTTKDAGQISSLRVDHPWAPNWFSAVPPAIQKAYTQFKFPNRSVIPQPSPRKKFKHLPSPINSYNRLV